MAEIIDPGLRFKVRIVQQFHRKPEVHVIEESTGKIVQVTALSINCPGPGQTSTLTMTVVNFDVEAEIDGGVSFVRSGDRFEYLPTREMGPGI